MRRKAERFAPYAAVLGASLLAEASVEVEADATSFSEEEALSALDSAFDSLLDSLADSALLSPEDSLCEEEAAVDSLADVLWFSPDAPDEEELLEELLLSDVLPEEAAGFDSGAETLLTEMVSVLLLTVVPL